MGPAARKGFKQDDSKRVEIDGLGRRRLARSSLKGANFRSGVSQCALERLKGKVVVLVHVVRQPVIGDHGVPVFIKEYVARLQVSVGNARLVQGRKSLRHLPTQPGRQSDGQHVNIFQQILERVVTSSGLNEVQEQAGTAILVAVAVGPRNSRVLHLCHRGELSLQAFFHFSHVRLSRVKSLHGIDLAGCEVPDLYHGPKSSLSQKLLYPQEKVSSAQTR